jgi:hypothetical protein
MDVSTSDAYPYQELISDPSSDLNKYAIDCRPLFDILGVGYEGLETPKFPLLVCCTPHFRFPRYCHVTTTQPQPFFSFVKQDYDHPSLDRPLITPPLKRRHSYLEGTGAAMGTVHPPFTHVTLRAFGVPE